MHVSDPSGLSRLLEPLSVSLGFKQADPELLGYAVRVSVWGRWLIGLVCAVSLAYRPGLWYRTEPEFLLLLIPLAVCNGVAHFRLHTSRQLTWVWILLLGAMDLALVTGGVAIAGRFHVFAYLLYYPVLALVAVSFTSLWLTFAWTTLAAAAYALVAVFVVGLDLETGQEKAMVARMLTMYGVAGCVCLVGRFERLRLQRSTARERAMHRERVELSQAIHDTAAQTAYMAHLGLARARRLAGDSNPELADTLAATGALTRSVLWDLRRPIDQGHIYEGRELGRVLRSHVENFGRIAGVAAVMHQSGAESGLSVETGGRLFSIAHNALANALLHAQASRVEVTLEFVPGEVVLTVSDDGVGLPDDYAQRGRGFPGMRAEAERLGGRLLVGPWP